jgi:hypothetical protein
MAKKQKPGVLALGALVLVAILAGIGWGISKLLGKKTDEKPKTTAEKAADAAGAAVDTASNALDTAKNKLLAETSGFRDTAREWFHEQFGGES